MMGIARPLLVYSHSRLRRRRFTRFAVLLLAVIALIFWGLWHRVATYVHWRVPQGQILTHVIAADQIVYEEGPATLTPPAASAGVLRRSGSDMIWFLPPIDPFRKYMEIVRPGDQNYLSGDACLFLGRRRDATTGADRIVHVAWTVRARSKRSFMSMFSFRLISPGTMRSPPRLIINSGKTPLDADTHVLSYDDVVFCFYAGQPDAADESHFVIPYAVSGQLGHVDAWLRNEDVEFRYRDGLGKRRASAQREVSN
jgi:hypothetical protein